MFIKLIKSPNKKKKYRVIFENKSKVDFGASGYSDYTIHKDPERMQRYLSRHRAREDWTKKGIKTAGFWSRWLLWSEPSMSKAKQLIAKKFQIKIRNA